jgi:hypothetical protein
LDPREHPLRRRYAHELALGLALLAAALWALTCGEAGRSPARGNAGTRAEESG